MEIPTSVTALLVGAGVLLIISGLLGGGFEIKEIKIPRISLVSRILCFSVGAVFIALVLVPQSDRDGDSDMSRDNGDDTRPIAPPRESDTSVSVMSLIGLSPSEAAIEVESQGLAIGNVSSKVLWAPHGQVVEQSLEAGVSALPGARVDLVVADSQFTFRAEREITNKEGTLSARFEYQVKRFVAEGTKTDLGEFRIVNVRIDPFEPELQRIVDKLESSTGYVQFDELDDYKPEDSWDAFLELAQDMNKDLATENISGSNAGFGGLSDVFWLVGANLEIGFDLRAIFLTPRPESISDKRVYDVQKGTKIYSSIRVEGPTALVAAGVEQAYDILRRAPDETRYEKVGRATYSVEDGSLRKLSAAFHVGSRNEVFYSVEIERL